MASRDDLETVRARLEQRFLDELGDAMAEVGIRESSRRDLARHYVAAAIDDAVNATPAAWTQAFERKLLVARHDLREVREDAGTATAKDRELDRAMAFTERGRSHLKAKDYDAARSAFEDARRIFARLDMEVDAATCVVFFATIDRNLRRFRDAEAHMTEAVRVFDRLGYQEKAAASWALLGDLAARRRDRATARECRQKALARYTNAGLRDGDAAQALMILLRNS